MGGKPSHRQKTVAVATESFFRSPSKGKPYDYLYRIILIGDLDAGKTCTCGRFAGEDVCVYYYRGSIGLDFKIRNVNLDETWLRLQLWDMPGLGFRSMTRAYLGYRGYHGIILVYDPTSQESFDNIPYWMEEARKNGHPDTVLMLVGGKSDLTEGKMVAYETAKDFADKNDIMFFEVSAKDGINTDLALMTLVAKIREKN